MVRWVPIASSTALLTNSCSSALWHWQAARTWTRLETQGDGLECHYILISTQWLCITSLDFIAYNYMYSTCTCCLNNWFCPNCSPPSEWCSLSGQQRTFAMVPKLERWTKTQQLCEHAAAQNSSECTCNRMCKWIIRKGQLGITAFFAIQTSSNTHPSTPDIK